MNMNVNPSSQRQSDDRTVEDGISVVINGQERRVPSGSTVGDFLASRGYRVTMVIVEVNGVIVPRDTCESRVLGAGDRIEMVHAVGGG